MKDRFNPSTYMVIDRITGDEVDVAMFVQETSRNGWEKAYASAMADYIGIGGDGVAKILAYFIRSRNRHDNYVIGTYKVISDKTGVSKSTVIRTMKKMLDGGHIKKKQNGVYMVNPNLIRYGSKTVGVIMMKLWHS